MLYQNKKGDVHDVTDGLCLCGAFSNSTDVGKIVKGQTKNYSRHDQHRKDGNTGAHLYCLYWTSTGGNIKEKTQIISRNFQAVRALVENYTGTDPYTDLPEIDDEPEEVGKIPIFHTSIFNPLAVQRVIAVENRVRQRFAVQTYSLPNIILYDFVNKETSMDIIRLNNLSLD